MPSSGAKSHAQRETRSTAGVFTQKMMCGTFSNFSHLRKGISLLLRETCLRSIVLQAASVDYRHSSGMAPSTCARSAAVEGAPRASRQPRRHGKDCSVDEAVGGIAAKGGVLAARQLLPPTTRTSFLKSTSVAPAHSGPARATSGRRNGEMTRPCKEAASEKQE